MEVKVTLIFYTDTLICFVLDAKLITLYAQLDELTHLIFYFFRVQLHFTFLHLADTFTQFMHSLGIKPIISAMLYHLSNNKYFLLPSCIAHFELVAVHPGIALPMKHSCNAVFDFGLNFVPEMLSAV